MTKTPQEIRARIAELSAEIKTNIDENDRKRAERTRLKKQLVQMGASAREVSDHAVVRFLERVKRFDVESVREELRTLADEAEAMKANEHYWHAGTGFVLLLNKDGGIITVLDEKQSAQHEGRKLKDGKKAVRIGAVDES